MRTKAAARRRLAFGMPLGDIDLLAVGDGSTERRDEPRAGGIPARLTPAHMKHAAGGGQLLAKARGQIPF